MEHTPEDSTSSDAVDGVELPTDSFALAGLDALPSQVAIVDDEGTVVYTNTAWRDFVRRHDFTTDSGFVGRQYRAACDKRYGEGAETAIAGIESVLSGDSEEFSQEYQFDDADADERSWFSMRAIRFRHDGERYALVLHLDVTQRKRSELAAKRRNAQLRTVNRISVLVREIIGALVDVEQRTELEELVCERLVDSEYYECSWVAGDDVTDSVTPTASAGASEDFLTAVADLSPEEVAGSGVRAAFEEGIYNVVRSTGDDAGPLQRLALDHGLQSYVAVPITYREVRYGALVVHSSGGDAFGEWECAALDVLGETLGHAINALENRRLLFSDYVTELEFAVADERSFLAALSDRSGGEVALTGFVPLRADTTLQYVTVEGADAATVLAAAEQIAAVEDATVISELDDGCRVECTVREPSLVPLLAEYGVNVKTAVANGGEVELLAEAVADVELREVLDAIRETFDDAELVAKRETQDSTRTVDEYWEDVQEQLTDRQLSMLRAAYYAGFFEWPRDSSGEEVAASFDIAAATFHEHTRVGLSKLLGILFDHERSRQ